MNRKRPYGGISAEQRQVDRRARLIETGLDLLATGGPAKVTVTAVCSTSRITERYFYENFTDRDALLNSIFEHTADDAALAISEAVTAAAPDPRIRAQAAVTVMLNQLTGDPRLSQIAIESHKNHVLDRVRIAITQRVSTSLESQAPLFWDDIADRQSEVRLACLICIAGIAETMAAWLAGTVAFDRDELLERCADLLIVVGQTVLGRAHREPPPSDRNRTSTFPRPLRR